MTLSRRRFVHLCATLPLCGLSALTAACRDNGQWPEGMAAIRWDRDVCVRCGMIISDFRFAAQIYGGHDKQLVKFDDPGCLVFWLREHQAQTPWLANARFWVADNLSADKQHIRWIDPRQAHYIRRTSPMGYHYAAVSTAPNGSLDFATAQARILAMHELGATRAAR